MEHLVNDLSNRGERVELPALNLVEQPAQLWIAGDGPLEMRLRTGGGDREHLAREILAPPLVQQPFVDEGLLEQRRREHLAAEVFAVASARAKVYLERAVAGDPELRRLLDEVQSRELDPLTAVREIIDKVFHLGDGNHRPDTH